MAIAFEFQSALLDFVHADRALSVAPRHLVSGIYTVQRAERLADEIQRLYQFIEKDRQNSERLSASD